MQDKKNKRKLKKSLKYQLEDILSIAKEVNSSISVIYSYCKYRNDSETVYNILHMLADSEKKSENICRKLCDILNEDSEQVSEFLSKILPLDFSNVNFDD